MASSTTAVPRGPVIRKRSISATCPADSAGRGRIMTPSGSSGVAAGGGSTRRPRVRVGRCSASPSRPACRGQLAPQRRGEAPKIIAPKSQRRVRVVPQVPRLHPVARDKENRSSRFRHIFAAQTRICSPSGAEATTVRRGPARSATRASSTCSKARSAATTRAATRRGRRCCARSTRSLSRRRSPTQWKRRSGSFQAVRSRGSLSTSGRLVSTT
jgi:hypothetical protein